MKFSIIVPVYNVEAFLPNCLDSILVQDFQDFEVIIINDVTPDNSQKIIDRYQKIDQRIKSIIHDTNKGLGGARNTGINHAKGDYILFLDSDDWIENQSLSVLNKHISSTPEIVKFGYIEKSASKAILSPTYSEQQFPSGWAEILEEIKNKSFSPICWRSIYKTSFIRQNNISFPEKLHFEDFSFTIKTHLLASNVVTIPNHLYYYRQEREGSIMHRPSLRDIEVCLSLEIIKRFIASSNNEIIGKSISFNFLMYEWSAGTTIYRYLKSPYQKKLKKTLISQIRHNDYFQFYLDQIIHSESISFSRKLPVLLLRKNFTLFKVLYKIYLLIKK